MPPKQKQITGNGFSGLHRKKLRVKREKLCLLRIQESSQGGHDTFAMPYIGGNDL